MSEGKYELTLLALGLLLFAALLTLNAAVFRPVQALPLPSATQAIPSAQTQNVPQQKVNLNTADEQQLMTLPGIGQTRASAIVAYRAENGLFRSLQELEQVPGIGPGLVAQLSESITLE